MNMSFYKILIVEDSRAIQAALEGLFNGIPHVSAFSLEEAWKILNKENVDLVLLDVNLPDGNGYDFCEKMRLHSKFNYTPVIFLTGNARTEEIERGFHVGGNDYVKKPFILEELYARIKNQLRTVEFSRVIQQQKVLCSEEAAIAKLNHEINNPLQIAMGYLKRMAPKDPSDAESFQKVQGALDRIAKLVTEASKAHDASVSALRKQLLELSKKEAA